MTRDTETCSDILVLEGRHMIAVLLYLRDHEGCMKSDIYRALTRTPRFPEKLDLLESSGLITVDEEGDLHPSDGQGTAHLGPSRGDAGHNGRHRDLNRKQRASALFPVGVSDGDLKPSLRL